MHLPPAPLPGARWTELAVATLPAGVGDIESILARPNQGADNCRRAKSSQFRAFSTFRGACHQDNYRAAVRCRNNRGQ